jgi:transcriptional regulator with XRE-family HTH domain
VPTISDRLREQREALGLSQQVLADRCGISARSQRNYESGERLPDAAYLAAFAAAGADVLYILTGSREGPPPVVLTSEEQTMLSYFREASKEVRRAALGALLGAAPSGRVGGTHSQHSTGDGAIQIGSMGNVPAKRRR